MYISRERCVYYYNPETGDEELFITVHPSNGIKTPEEQAIILARTLNNMPVIKENKS